MSPVKNPDPGAAPHERTPPPHRELRDWTYHVFLLVLVLTYLISPVLTEFEELLPLQRQFTAGVLVSGLIVLRRRHRDWVVGTLLLVPAVVGDVISNELEGTAHGIALGTSVLYLLFLAGLILHRIFYSRHVTPGTISAALSLYLVMALAWGAVYDFVDTFEENPSFSEILPANAVTTLQERQQRSFQLQYYSMVTITTLGYGDILPKSNLTRALATLEAFFGQMFLAVLVARLVSLYTAEQARSRGSSA